jgi:hypothetical protein
MLARRVSQWSALPVAAWLGLTASGAWAADTDPGERKNAFTFETGADELLKRSQDLRMAGSRDVLYLATLKKYFGDPRGIRPFVAGGVGLIAPGLAGSMSRNAAGSAAQAAAGLRYEVGRTSVIAEYRYVWAPSSDLDARGEMGDVQGKVNLGGQAYFLGLGIKF